MGREKYVVHGIEIRSFLDEYYHNLTEDVILQTSPGVAITVPRKALRDHLQYFAEGLLRHLDKPWWTIRGCDEAKDFVLRLSSTDTGPVLSLCCQLRDNPEKYLTTEQLKSSSYFWVKGRDGTEINHIDFIAKYGGGE